MKNNDVRCWNTYTFIRNEIGAQAPNMANPDPTPSHHLFIQDDIMASALGESTDRQYDQFNYAWRSHTLRAECLESYLALRHDQQTAREYRCMNWNRRAREFHETQMNRINMANLQSHRWEVTHHLDPVKYAEKLAARANWIVQVREARAKNDIERLFHLASQYNDTGHAPRINRLKLMPREFMQKFRDYDDRFYASDDSVKWVRSVWANASFSGWSAATFFHFVHVSQDDPAQIAYYPTYRHFMEDRPVRTKPGKYLMKYHHTSVKGGTLSDQDVKYWADLQIESQKPVDLHLVPNTDPDGWEWVYEHGKGFQSCMVWDRDDRYLSSECEDYHPVRAYAHPENHLALAWIGDATKFKSSSKAVYARAIVNTNTMTYVRIYGDERIGKALEREGYTYSQARTLRNEVMYAECCNGDDYFLPYLDWGSYEWHDEDRQLVKITENGCDGESCGITRMKPTERCQECGDPVDTDDDRYLDSEGGYICEYCLDYHFVWARVSRYDHEYIRTDGTVENRSNGETVSLGYAENNLAQTEDGDWYSPEDVVDTPTGSYYIDDCVELARAYHGRSYAHENDVKVVDGELYYKDDDTSDIEPLDFLHPALFVNPTNTTSIYA